MWLTHPCRDHKSEPPVGGWGASPTERGEWRLKEEHYAEHKYVLPTEADEAIAMWDSLAVQPEVVPNKRPIRKEYEPFINEPWREKYPREDVLGVPVEYTDRDGPKGGPR